MNLASTTEFVLRYQSVPDVLEDLGHFWVLWVMTRDRSLFLGEFLLAGQLIGGEELGTESRGSPSSPGKLATLLL